MYACAFKLNDADYSLKAGDVVEVSRVDLFPARKTRLAFYAADGSLIHIAGRSGRLLESFHLPEVERGTLLPLISLLTGLTVSEHPTVDGEGKRKYELLAK